MKPQIVLYNPHVDDFIGVPIHFRFLKRRALKKYGFIVDELLNEQGGVPVFIDGTASAFIPPRIFKFFPGFLRNIVVSLEYAAWVRINGFTKVKRISISSDDVGSYTLLVFSYKAASGNFSQRFSMLRKFRHVVFHLSHYFVSTGEKSENISRLPNAWLAGDSDISENEYFRVFFGWYKRPFLTLPFAVKARFKKITTLSQREPRCIATGSVHNLRLERPVEAYADYISCTELDTYHPVRKQIYEARERIAAQVECMIAPYRDYHSSSPFLKWWSHFFVSQKGYFSKDIVEVYNQYRFAVIGEEATGFPAVGMFEAMASGCVVFGNPRMLKGLHLQPGQHYLPYDGTLDGLLDALSLAADRADLDYISALGQQVAQESFSEQAVGRLWLKTVRSLR